MHCAMAVDTTVCDCSSGSILLRHTPTLSYMTISATPQRNFKLLEGKYCNKSKYKLYQKRNLLHKDEQYRFDGDRVDGGCAQ